MVGFPLLLIPLAIYNIIVFLMPSVSLTDALVKVPLMTSGAEWPVTMSEILLALGILMLLLEVIKGARPGAKFLTDHLLSLIVFGAAAAEFLPCFHDGHEKVEGRLVQRRQGGVDRCRIAALHGIGEQQQLGVRRGSGAERGNCPPREREIARCHRLTKGAARDHGIVRRVGQRDAILASRIRDVAGSGGDAAAPECRIVVRLRAGRKKKRTAERDARCETGLTYWDNSALRRLRALPRRCSGSGP